jgi:hypothetical protein
MGIKPSFQRRLPGSTRIYWVVGHHIYICVYTYCIYIYEYDGILSKSKSVQEILRRTLAAWQPGASARLRTAAWQIARASQRGRHQRSFHGEKDGHISKPPKKWDPQIRWS